MKYALWCVFCWVASACGYSVFLYDAIEHGHVMFAHWFGAGVLMSLIYVVANLYWLADELEAAQ